MSDGLKSFCLLLFANVFMTTAWYWHLKVKNLPLFAAIFASWGIALFEYMLQVPANRIGYRVMSAFQLKIMAESIALVVFVVFSWLVLDERLTPRHALAFGLILAAVGVAFKR